MHKLMEGGIWIRLGFFSGRLVLAVLGIDRFCAQRCSGIALFKISGQKKLPGLCIANEDSALVVGLGIFYVVSKIGVARGQFRRKSTTNTVDEVVSANRIAVGPPPSLAQMEDKL